MASDIMSKVKAQLGIPEGVDLVIRPSDDGKAAEIILRARLYYVGRIETSTMEGISQEGQNDLVGRCAGELAKMLANDFSEHGMDALKGKSQRETWDW